MGGNASSPYRSPARTKNRGVWPSFPKLAAGPLLLAAEARNDVGRTEVCFLGGKPAFGLWCSNLTSEIAACLIAEPEWGDVSCGRV